MPRRLETHKASTKSGVITALLLWPYINLRFDYVIILTEISVIMVVSLLQKYKSKREEGFTIIEVLIVLAIAGLIILIVFLAVPALQRNSRNHQRTDDAARFVAAFKECLTNNKASGSACFGPGILDYVDLTKNLQLINLVIDQPTDATDTMNAHDGMQCNKQGTGTEPTALTRHIFAVTYLVETSTSTAPRCFEVGV